MEKIAEKNLRIQWWINFIAWVVFLIPIITLFYKYTWLSTFDIIIISNVSTLFVWILEIPTSVLADTNWRKKSLIYSVSSNLFGAITILLFPNYVWFIIASIFSALYWSFWSGTGQAFLEENLRILKREKEFWKKIGSFMFYEQLAMLVTPLFASMVLKIFGNIWYTILAWLDVLFSFILVLLVFQLTESTQVKQKFTSIKEAYNENLQVAKEALNNTFKNEKVRLSLIYRSLWNHVAFFPLLVLPILSEKWMLDWYSWFLMAIATVWWMLASKYAYIIWEKYSYNFAWVASTIAQAICLIIVGIFFTNWIFISFIFIIFNTFEGLWMPSWSHVLVELTNGTAVATTRSIVFSVFALYTTVWKQFLSFFDIQYALIGLGIFILLVNIIFGKKILMLNRE